MKTLVLVLTHIGIGYLVIQRSGSIPKPIHVIAITFFTMIMVYASFSLILEAGQCFHVVKKYINPDVMKF